MIVKKIITSISISIVVLLFPVFMSFVSYFNSIEYCDIIFIVSVTLVLLHTFVFAFNVMVERNYIDYNIANMYYIYIFGFYIFLITEMMVFFSLFWIYFGISMDPNSNIGFSWLTINYFDVLSNHYSIVSWMNYILIISSLIVSLCYLFFNANSFRSYWYYILMSILVLFGLQFVCMQYYEYNMSFMHIDSGIIASTLYLISGLHGLHVVIGIILLFISVCRLLLHYFDAQNKVGLVVSVYYWHFVDLIWILVYFTQYVNAQSVSFDWLIHFVYLDFVDYIENANLIAFVNRAVDIMQIVAAEDQNS